MTVPEEPDELDELASARLDGASTPDDDARAADPAVAAEVARRQARFARVRDVLAEPVAVDDDARESAIAAALAAFPPADELPDDLAARRSMRTRRRTAGLKVLGAAAAVIAAVALGAAVLTGSDDGADTAGEAPTAGDADRDGSGADRGADSQVAGEREGAEADDSGSGAVPSAAARLALGEFADVEALLAAVAVAEDTGAAYEGSGGGTASDADLVACTDELLADRERFAPEALGALLATATVDGVAVAVYSITDGGMLVVDLVTCTVVAPIP